MGKKIRSFADYDAAKAEREENIGQQVKSKLEFLVDNHPSIKKIKQETQREKRKEIQKLTPKIRNGRVMLSPAAKEIFYSPIEIEINEKQSKKIAIQRQLLMTQLQPNARRDTLVDMVKYNVRDLILCGIEIANANEDVLSEENKNEVYSRFRSELNLLSENGQNKYFKREFPDLDYFLSRPCLSGPEEIEAFNKVLFKLAKEGYIMKDHPNTLIELLTKEPEEVQPEKPYLSPQVKSNWKKASRETVPKAETIDQTAEVISYLINRGIDGRDAAAYSTEIKFADLKLFCQGLERYVGQYEEESGKFFQENYQTLLPCVVDKHHTKYLTTLQKIQDKIRENNNGERDKLIKKYG